MKNSKSLKQAISMLSPVFGACVTGGGSYQLSENASIVSPIMAGSVDGVDFRGVDLGCDWLLVVEKTVTAIYEDDIDGLNMIIDNYDVDWIEEFGVFPEDVQMSTDELLEIDENKKVVKKEDGGDAELVAVVTVEKTMKVYRTPDGKHHNDTATGLVTVVGSDQPDAVVLHTAKREVFMGRVTETEDGAMCEFVRYGDFANFIPEGLDVLEEITSEQWEKLSDDPERCLPICELVGGMQYVVRKLSEIREASNASNASNDIKCEQCDTYEPEDARTEKFTGISDDGEKIELELSFVREGEKPEPFDGKYFGDLADAISSEDEDEDYDDEIEPEDDEAFEPEERTRADDEDDGWSFVDSICNR